MEFRVGWAAGHESRTNVRERPWVERNNTNALACDCTGWRLRRHVCVCVREREREKGENKGCEQASED